MVVPGEDATRGGGRRAKDAQRVVQPGQSELAEVVSFGDERVVEVAEWTDEALKSCVFDRIGDEVGFLCYVEVRLVLNQVAVASQKPQGGAAFFAQFVGCVLRIGGMRDYVVAVRNQEGHPKLVVEQADRNGLYKHYSVVPNEVQFRILSDGDSPPLGDVDVQSIDMICGFRGHNPQVVVQFVQDRRGELLSQKGVDICMRYGQVPRALKKPGVVSVIFNKFVPWQEWRYSDRRIYHCDCIETSTDMVDIGFVTGKVAAKLDFTCLRKITKR